MLNAILAGITVVTWSVSYGWYFGRDVRRWWRLRHVRRAEAERARAEAIAAYIAWTQNIPPPRSRVAVMPPPPAAPVATPVSSGVVVPFPPSRRVRRR